MEEVKGRATRCHTRGLLAGIHPKIMEDGFPITNVGNDKKRRHWEHIYRCRLY